MTRRGSGRGGRRRAAAPSPRPWRERVADPDEPLFTIGIAAELLGTDTQSLRRLEEAVSHVSARPSGNQRRYSRNDLELFDTAIRLSLDGHPPGSIPRIIELERKVAGLAEG